jgi:hypothetical protein
MLDSDQRMVGRLSGIVIFVILLAFALKDNVTANYFVELVIHWMTG